MLGGVPTIGEEEADGEEEPEEERQSKVACKRQSLHYLIWLFQEPVVRPTKRLRPSMAPHLLRHL